MEENKHRKSKALIITIIAIIILLIVGFLLYKNRDVFGVKTSNNIAKVFSPLTTTSNTKKTLAQAGEDIKEGDKVSYAGKNTSGVVIVMKAKSDTFDGFSNQDIKVGETGEITPGKNDNSFWNSFSDLLGNIFNKPGYTRPGDTGNSSSNGSGDKINYPGDPNYIAGCSDKIDNNGDGLIDELDPNCHTGGVLTGEYQPNHSSESEPPYGDDMGGGYARCSDKIDNDKDGSIDELDPNCHTGGVLTGEYQPNHYSESESPYDNTRGNGNTECSDKIDNDKDGSIDELDPNCHIEGDLKKAYIPNHYSEAESPYSYIREDRLTECNDKIDNDKDTQIDSADPNCHIDGDLKKAYVPSHYSESLSPLGNIKDPDLLAGGVSPISTTINTLTNLSSTISNYGGSSTKESFSSFFTITTDDPNIQTGATKNVELSVVVPALESGIKSIAIVSHSFDTAGVYYIRACADKISSSSSGSIVESNEDNNCGDWTTFTVTSSLPTEGVLSQCNDDMDNDGDKLIDELDPECHIDGDLDKEYLPNYNSESNSPVECNDTMDNDGDDLADEDDPQCHVDGELSNQYLPNYNSESNSPVECNDTIDNGDYDILVDAKDPECHLGGVLSGEYYPTNTSEDLAPVVPSVCKDISQNPLSFTEEEKAKLAVLLRKFYLIAPSLKTEDDIISIYSDIDQYQNLINQADGLTKQCKAQTAEGKYFGIYINEKTGSHYTPSTLPRRGNPWYREGTGGVLPFGSEYDTRGYLDYDAMTWNGNIGQGPDGKGGACPLISGYYSGKTVDGEDCAKFTPPGECWGTIYSNLHGDDTTVSTRKYDYPGTIGGVSLSSDEIPNQELIKKGCTWHEGVFLDYTEKILNIW